MARGEPKLVKTTGQIEAFSESKLRGSLSRSGASRDEVDRIVAAVRKRLRDGMATSEVFQIAHRLLRVEGRDKAARYSLQRAIQRLGPDGFPFERFLAELWRHEGFKVRTGVHLHGRFVRHEVDLVGLRGREKRLGECKFRSQSDGKVDIKTALYVHARAADLKVTGFREFWLVTNGRFTKDALTYGSGVGIQMISWDHPKGDSLRERIDRAGLHPITVLSTLHLKEQAELLRAGLVLCADLKDQPEEVDRLRLSHGRAEQLWREVEGLVAGGLRQKPSTVAARRRVAAAVEAEVGIEEEDDAGKKKKKRRRGRRGGRRRRGSRGRGRAGAATAAADDRDDDLGL